MGYEGRPQTCSCFFPECFLRGNYWMILNTPNDPNLELEFPLAWPLPFSVSPPRFMSSPHSSLHSPLFFPFRLYVRVVFLCKHPLNLPTIDSARIPSSHPFFTVLFPKCPFFRDLFIQFLYPIRGTCRFPPNDPGSCGFPSPPLDWASFTVVSWGKLSCQFFCQNFCGDGVCVTFLAAPWGISPRIVYKGQRKPKQLAVSFTCFSVTVCSLSSSLGLVPTVLFRRSGG